MNGDETDQAGCPLAWAGCARRARRRASAMLFDRLMAWTLAFSLLSGMAGSASFADEVSREQMQGLDEQVQEVKSDVLGIAAELSLLEERLLYPSDTQVGVFVSLAEGDNFRLDSVQIRIDGEAVAHHIYSFKELEALRKGGVQRIYTGNVVTGEHRLEVSVAGKLAGGADFSESQAFGFRKEVEPKLVGITLSGQDGDGRIQLDGW